MSLPNGGTPGLREKGGISNSAAARGFGAQEGQFRSAQRVH